MFILCKDLLHELPIFVKYKNNSLMKKKLVVLTGAGMSAESGISTFRDSDGLWEKYRVEDVATPEGFASNPELVLNFYNQRRRELLNTRPNAGHIGLAELEKDFDVHIITQNIDNLHEQAGSSDVIHLHGELMQACLRKIRISISGIKILTAYSFVLSLSGSVKRSR